MGKNSKSLKLKAFLDSQIKDENIITYGEGENALEIKIKPILPFDKKVELIRKIANSVFLDDGKDIESYMPEYQEFITKYTIIDYYTDFEMPAKINDAWLIINYTSLFDDVSSHILKDIEQIYREVDELVKAKRDYLVRQTDINKLVNKISETIEKASSKIEGLDFEKIAKTLKDIPQLQDNNIGNLISDIINKNQKN